MNSEGKQFRLALLANVVTVVVVLMLVLLYQVRSILPPVLSALLVAYLLYPVVNWGYRVGVPRLVTTLVVVMLLIGSTVLIAVSFLPAIRQQVRVILERVDESKLVTPPPGKDEEWRFTPPDEPEPALDLELEPPPPAPAVPATSTPDGVESAAMTEAALTGGTALTWRENLRRFLDRLHDFGWPTFTKEDIIRKITTFVVDESVGAVRKVTGLAVEWGRFLMVFFFVLIFALMDGHRLQRWLIGLLPNEFYESGLFVLHQTEKILGDYLRGLFVENLILGILSVVVLFPVCFFSNLKLLLVLIIALLFAVTNAVRIVGPIIGGALGVFLAFTYTGEVWVAVAVAAAAVITQLLDATVLLPLVMQDQVNLHPVICLLGIVMGGIVGGILGMILAIPVISGVKVVYRVVRVEMKRYVEPERYGDYTAD